jgi:two-component system, OmpR family, response regulator
MQYIGNQDQFTVRGSRHDGALDFSATRVLMVIGDPDMRDMIASYFRKQDMDAVSVSGEKEMLRQLTMAQPSLVILDLRFGDEDGMNLLREIRSRSDIPVIIVSGHRGDDIDRIIGLELGADDCITQPFSPRELLARVRAILRRLDLTRTAALRNPERGGFRFGGWQLERGLRRLTDQQGNVVPLTKGEYALLIAFLDAPQRPLSREYLLQATRLHEDIFDRSIDVQVLRLRRKLEPDAAASRHIRTERGLGYVFVTPVERF